MPHNRNNQNYTRLRLAFALTDAQVIECMHEAGEQISKSKANGWWRGKESGRVKAMSDEQFDAFCAGLLVVSRRSRRKTSTS